MARAIYHWIAQKIGAETLEKPFKQLQFEEVSNITGILLDVSGSMKDSIGDGIDEEDGTWAQSIFTVIDDLVEHDISENNGVFSIGFGASIGNKIFDIIGTIHKLTEIESSVDTEASETTIEEIFRLIETNGAKRIRQWAEKSLVSTLVSEHNAQIILNRMKSDKQFKNQIVFEILPIWCRDVEDQFLDDISSLATTVITGFRKASVQEIKEVAEKAMKLPIKVSNDSVLSVRQAARIIRKCNDNRNITKQRARELHTAVEPYIYGDTPLFSAFKEALSLFSKLQSSYPEHDRLLFVLSDGKPTDNGDHCDLQLKLKRAKVTVVCCYISRSSNVEPRTLHSVEGPNWEKGARFLFKLSSTIATQLVTRAIFVKRGWNIDITNNQTKLFMQVNHPDHLREACNLARNIVYSQDALADLLGSVSLDIYINQKNIGFRAQLQNKGTCYANASAAVLHLAMHRVCGRTGGYPDFEILRDALINIYGSAGANTFEVLRHFCPIYRLHCIEVNIEGAMKAVAEKRPVVATFRLSDENWQRFELFYRRYPTGILRKEDLDFSRRNRYASHSGHAVVLTSYNSESLRLMSSWGEEWADNGFFRVENADILGLQFLDVYWTLNDLFPDEIEYYRVHGSKVAEKLMLSLKGLQVAMYECPLCRRKSKVTRFSGSLSRAICPRCKDQFSCQDGKGNILALNVYLTSLSR